ncbi:MAG: hypothetical protein AAF316_03515 [Cyanobacteria bacterium P01_A01_bin.80]
MRHGEYPRGHFRVLTTVAFFQWVVSPQLSNVSFDTVKGQYFLEDTGLTQ